MVRRARASYDRGVMWLGFRLGRAAALFAMGTSACSLEASGTAFPEIPDGSPDVVIPVEAGGDANAEAGTIVYGALVSAATVSSSTSYRVIGTLGQGPTSNAVMRSPSFTFTGGVVGATQQK